MAKFSKGDTVSFEYSDVNGKLYTLTGAIEVVDPYMMGTEYDVMVFNFCKSGAPALVKHVDEKALTKID